FTRHLSNNVSGFAAYSNTDRHTSYAFDREGFRWTASDPSDPCLAAPATPVATDPVAGLDGDDELVFMARDAGTRAPAGAALPAGVEGAHEVAVVDPSDGGPSGYVYVMKAGDDGPRAAFDSTNGYVRYERDADADVFRFSQSSYSNYGNAPKGPWRDDAGTCHTAEEEWKQRRPGDEATITTPRYRFRYDGRWLMTALQVSADADGDWTYGADMVDQWKARAFQQRPGGQTPCCGYEEEENNWGGSSQLLGERVGPVRAIRETWGADSGTNVVRREVFYRDEIRQRTYLRVHVIPPLDGIYAQWDHTAGAVTRYYNPLVPDGVDVDGRNDEAFGNQRVHVGFDGISIDGNDTTSELLRSVTGGTPLTLGSPNEPDCRPADPLAAVYDGWDDLCIHNDVDIPDPLFSGPSVLLSWEQVSGPAGTLVTRWSPVDVTAGGLVQSALAVPYYRDDSCFDDGTGSDPGPHLAKRRTDEGADATWTDAEGTIRPRECWDAARHADDPDYAATVGTRRFWQGSVGTHGLHILLIADSDNAFTTVPLTEINAEQRMVVLPPTEGNVGEQYGRSFEKPLLTTVAPFEGTTTAATHLELSAPAGGAHGDPVTVSATLTRTGGAPVAGRELTFSVGSTSVTATTSDDGSASATLVPTDPPGVTDVVVAFAGGDGDGPSRATASFEITRESTALTALGATRQRSEHRVSAQLVEDDGPPVAGRTVEFEAGGVSTTAVTDPDGVAEAVLRLSGGDRSWTVAFAGDDVYEPSTASATSR
ncbi:MAG TPA: Ig-like domain-containing protein, partial [Nocardioides sp.]|nr:Ig-like domain-containing protein [Nocardioides sp.]